MTTLSVLLLAAGQGTRMQSKRQKILHEVGGKPMLLHLFEAAESIVDMRPVVVIGPGGDGVKALLGDRAQYVVQAEQLGTGHAVRMAASVLNGRSDQVIVTYGDMPLLRAETMTRLALQQSETQATIVMMTVMGDPKSSFGRVLRDEEGHVLEIVEVAEAKQRANGQEILAVREMNAGVYCFDAHWLWQNITELPLRQARNGHEYYLTDLVAIAVAQGLLVDAVVTDDPDECLGAGTRAELVAVEKAFRRRANRRWLSRGVTLIDPDSTFIDQDVVIGQDTVVWPNTFLQGDTAVGEDCTIGPNTILRNARVGHRCRIEQAVVENATVPDDTAVPPFTHLNGDKVKG